MLSIGQTLATAAGLRQRKKFLFDVTFNLQDLLNCTYVSGVLFVKIRLKDGGNFSYLSRRKEVHSHAVNWEEEVKFSCKLYASANTAELEPCVCKLSVRKETKGGRSYKKLGYVRVNLAEFAGGGIVQRKYLLESYNEHKHKPDNSILRIKVALKQTSGDILYRVPHPPVWEISEPEQDEGIQADLQSGRKSNVRASTASTLSGVSTGSGTGSGYLRVGGSLQDVQQQTAHLDDTKGKNTSSSSLVASHSSDSGSSEYESAGQQSSSSSLDRELGLTTSLDKPKAPLEKHSQRGKECAAHSSTAVVSVDQDMFRAAASKLGEALPERSNSVIGSELRQHHRPPTDGYSLSYPRSRRKEPNDVTTGKGSPSRVLHRRIHSLSISGNSSRSTSAYSTLSERSERVTAVDDSESVLSSRTRITTQSRVEQSRVDTSSVIMELLQTSDLSRSDGEAAGLQIYVDKTKGEFVVAGPDLQRRYSNLKPVEVPVENKTSHSSHHKFSSTPAVTKGEVKEQETGSSKTLSADCS